MPSHDRYPRDLPRIVCPVDLATLGIGRSTVRTQLRQERWLRLTDGILFTAPGQPGRADWINAGLTLAGPGSALSGRDAVALHELPARGLPDSPALVLARGGRHRTVGSVHIRPADRPYRAGRTPAGHAILPSIAFVSAARAVADASLGARWLEPVRAMVTTAVQRQACTIDDLVEEYDSGPRNGSAMLRQAIEDVVQGARSVSEAEALTLLRGGSLPSFELNVPFVDRFGTVRYVADVFWRALRAVLEVDSRAHHFLEADWRRTMERHNQLTAAGLAVTHYAPTVIRGLGPRWADEVGAWLRRRAAELAVAYQPASPGWRPPRDPAPYRLDTPAR